MTNEQERIALALTAAGLGIFAYWLAGNPRALSREMAVIIASSVAGRLIQKAEAKAAG